MSKQNGKDYLYLIWKNPKTRDQYTVGILTRNGQFEFKYDLQFNKAKQNGFKELVSFEDSKKIYTNKTLFPVFASRLPDKKRKDIQQILKKYNLDTYDEYMLLKKSGARLPIDTLEFIDPIFDDEYPILRTFYLAGAGHYLGCNHIECLKSTDVSLNEELYLFFEAQNEHDENAVQVKNSLNELLGYIPRYYSKQVKSMIDKRKQITCTVIEVNKQNSCRECIKVKLVIE